jgi:hypothetical protein
VGSSASQGFIPGGKTFVLKPPTGSTTFSWDADLLAGTSVIFAMTDSRGRDGEFYLRYSRRPQPNDPCPGGSSDIKVVGASGDNSCLNSTYPTSTPNPPSPTSSSTSPPTSSSPGQDDTKSSGPSTLTLALASLGGVLALAILAALIFFFFQRKRKRENAYSDGSYPYRGKHAARRMSLDLEEPRPIDNASDDQTVSHITPFSESHPASSSDRLRHSREDLQDRGVISPRSGPTSSNGRSKASQISSFRQPRYVVHTDVEDAVPEEVDQEVIELPPTYTERSGPGPSSTTGSSLYTNYHPPPPLSKRSDASQ